MITSTLAKRFQMFFKGKSNTYVKNRLPKERPALGHKTKTEITNEKGSVDDRLITAHLNGDFGVGICPVTTEGKCYFGVLDIDYYGEHINDMLHFIREYQLPLLPFRSKSGGLHCYLMLSKSVSAKTMRDTLNSIIYSLALDKLYGSDKVEVFPKQDKVSEESFGNSITLPYFNADNAYTYLLDLDGNEMSLDDALTYIQKHLTTIDAVKEALSSLPYNDAPPCIQRILLSHSVGGEDTGRNNFLFAYAVYSSKKYGESFSDYVREQNESFECPIPEQDVENTIRSVKEKEYSYPCKNIPCSSFCDKIQCHKREYGLGKDKGHFSDVDYGQLYRYMTAEPYYVWELRLQGSDMGYKKVVFRNEADMLDQKSFAKFCVRFLNFAPRQVSANDWFGTLNKYLASIKNVEVKEESDTSALSRLHNMFIRYLANKQSRRDSPFQIHMGLCIRQTSTNESGEPTAKYYFTHEGFTNYLANNKVVFDQTMLRETLMEFGAKEDILRYTGSMGKVVGYPCWSKEEDKVIRETYEGMVEVEAGDKSYITSVSDTNNAEDASVRMDEKPYTDEDKKRAEGMF